MSQEITHEYVSAEINKLIGEYDFPLIALQDIKNRLSDSDDPYYAAQQLRYLNKLIEAGHATRRHL
ncbi:hypothetical protein TCA2_4497 [Paenibacillus sp. TCA20]|uniref:DUF6877 family protein n=1 Tax=Paenibacillus sp. TCA20 TaxID=1499968 RepID=UPI0004DAC667|nr:DUF6877 family protein [Paenibacillus sp. TCA20]GAK42005.1 hypothetical protein TCA2_4497 [Paenibacillus sp. TCA20]